MGRNSGGVQGAQGEGKKHHIMNTAKRRLRGEDAEAYKERKKKTSFIRNQEKKLTEKRTSFAISTAKNYARSSEMSAAERKAKGISHELNKEALARVRAKANNYDAKKDNKIIKDYKTGSLKAMYNGGENGFKEFVSKNSHEYQDAIERKAYHNAMAEINKIIKKKK